MSRSRADLIILVVILVLFTLFNVTFVREGVKAARVEIIPRPDSYSAGPSGTLGLYTCLKESGFKVKRWTRSLSGLPKRGPKGVLFLIEPDYTSPVAEPEFDDIVKWVKAGNTVILMADAFVDFSADQVGFVQGWAAGGIVRAKPVQPTPLTAGVGQVTVDTGQRLKPPPRGAPATTLIADAQGTVLTDMPLGEGRVVGVADPLMFSNSRLRDEDNAVLAFNLASLCRGETVLFEEFHHGFTSEENVWSFCWKTPRRWPILQLLGGVAVLLFAQARRFGRPVAVADVVRRRSPTEYVTSMAELYRRAQASAAVMSILVREAKRRVARGLGITAEAAWDRVIASLSASPSARQAFAEAVADAEAYTKSDQPDEAQFFSLARRLFETEGEILGRR